jgi:unsaturated chondroitin disaccharide hydrolase
MLTAAATLDKRFCPPIGAFSSNWDKKPLPNSVPVVIDIMMNLEMLFWASQHGGHEQLRDHCISHANITCKDFIRGDGGSFHIVRYDKKTGRILNKGQLQGDVDASTWSRGHAWMIYGLTTVYRYTKDPRYLSMAMKAAEYFLNHLPEDRVAQWDFQSKINIRDASASAIVSSALFELQGYIRDTRKKKYYLNEAKKMLHSLCLPPYFSNGNNTNCLLLHSTQYYHETDNTDVPSAFADYYFLESIVRYKALQMKQR